MSEPFSLSINSVVKSLNSNTNYGLTESEVKVRINKYGKNEAANQRPESKWKVLIDQCNDPIIFILIIAAGLTFLFNNDLRETIAIITVILITIIIGFIMELQGIRSLETLRQMGFTESTVLRDGKIKTIKSSVLVPGDIILLEAGDIVSADARLITVENLAIKEALLTGESRDIFKHINSISKNTKLCDRKNMVFKGTTVEQGSAKAIVVHTGKNTQLGKIQQMGSAIEKQ